MGVLGRFAEAAAYALYTVGCVLFFVGCGGAFFEKERFYLRLFSAGVLFTVLALSAMEVPELASSHDMQIFLLLVIQIGVPLLVWGWEKCCIPSDGGATDGACENGAC